MTLAPVSLLIICTSTLALVALVNAQDLAAGSIITSVPQPDCTGDFDGIVGSISLIGCRIGQGLIFVFNLFLMLASVIAFFYNGLTFNIPGAPFYVRVMFATFFIGGFGWAIASMFRGTKA